MGPTEYMIVFGNYGSDAGWWILTPEGIKHVGGWPPAAKEAYEAMMKNYKILQEEATKHIEAERGANG